MPSEEGSLQAASPVPMKNIEKELICPVCKELLTHPLFLPCPHSVCHKCVKELLLLTYEDSLTEVGSEVSSSPGSPQSTQLQSPSTERLDRIVYSGQKRNSLNPKMTIFPCPGCERDIDLGERGINGLFRNFILETIVERYRQAARAATAIMCDFCKPPPQEATKSCLDCRESYCNKCFKVHHPWGTPKAQHECIGPTTNFRPKVLLCPEHEVEKANMYCKMCQRPVCRLCKLGGSHANHRLTSMSIACKVIKAKLSRSIHYLISNEDHVKTRINELEKLLEQTELNGEKAREKACVHYERLFKNGEKARETACVYYEILFKNVEKAREEAYVHFERFFKILEEQKTSVIQSIEEAKKSRLGKLQHQLEECHGMLENSGLVGYAQEVLKETNQSCFVQTAKQLHNRIKKATKSLKTFQPAAHACFEEFVIDLSKEESLLLDLFFMRGAVLPSEAQTQEERLPSSRWGQSSQSGDSNVLYNKGTVLPSEAQTREERLPSSRWGQRSQNGDSDVLYGKVLSTENGECTCASNATSAPEPQQQLKVMEGAAEMSSSDSGAVISSDSMPGPSRLTGNADVDHDMSEDSWLETDTVYDDPYCLDLLASEGSSDSDSASDDMDSAHTPRTGNTDWCQCGHCEAMETERECLCCHEAPRVLDKINDAEQSVGQGLVPECITIHPGFPDVCYSQWVLEMAFAEYRQYYGRQSFPINDRNRFLAYRCFTRWCEGWLHRHGKVILPACVVMSIRKRWPAEQYRGFQVAN